MFCYGMHYQMVYLKLNVSSVCPLKFIQIRCMCSKDILFMCRCGLVWKILASCFLHQITCKPWSSAVFCSQCVCNYKLESEKSLTLKCTHFLTIITMSLISDSFWMLSICSGWKIRNQWEYVENPEVDMTALSAWCK